MTQHKCTQNAKGKQEKSNTYLPYYYNLFASNKYVPQMSHMHIGSCAEMK